MSVLESEVKTLRREVHEHDDLILSLVKATERVIANVSVMKTLVFLLLVANLAEVVTMVVYITRQGG